MMHGPETAPGPLTRAQRGRISALFVLFEGRMPLLGPAAGVEH
jgi:hypothetical protein